MSNKNKQKTKNIAPKNMSRAEILKKLNKIKSK